ncbi:MAG: translocation/assembly module TamB domain-containing protein [Bacteroidota bacterium]
MRLVIFLLLLFIALVLTIRSEWGQNIIVGKVTQYVQKKTDTQFKIDRFYLTFSGNLSIEGLYLEDQKGDTLVYSKKLETDIPIRPIIGQQQININLVEWNGLKANVKKNQSSVYNFQFLIDAFASEDEKTESQNSYAFSLGKINFSDFDVCYQDETQNLDTRLRLGDFFVQVEDFSLEEMKFHLSEISLNQTQLDWIDQRSETPTKSQDKSEETESTLPHIIVDKFSFSAVEVNFQTTQDTTNLQTHLSELTFSGLDMNLAEQEISLSDFMLKDSKVALQTQHKKSQDMATAAQEEELSSSQFSWPNWQITIGNFQLENNAFSFQNNNQISQQKGFDPNAISVTNFQLDASNIQLQKDKKLNLDLNSLQLKEQSGFQLKETSFQLAVNDEKINLNNLRIATSKNNIQASITTDFSDLDALFNDFSSAKNSSIDLAYDIEIEEFFDLFPNYQEIVWLQQLSKHNLHGQLKANGNTDKLNLNHFTLNWGATRLRTNGKLAQLLSPDKIGYELNRYQISTTKSQLDYFFETDSIGVEIPTKINLKGSIAGNPTRINTKSQLSWQDGLIELAGKIDFTKELIYDIDLAVKEINPAVVFKNPDLEALKFQLSAKGKGTDLSSLNTKISTDFEQLTYRGYDFSPIDFGAEINNGKGDVNLNFKDNNLELEMLTTIVGDSLQPKYTTDFNVKGAKLKDLGLAQKDIRLRFHLEGEATGNSENLQAEVNTKDALVIFDNKQYHIGEFSMAADFAEDNTTFQTSSDFLEADLEANAHPSKIYPALINYFENLLATKSDETEGEFIDVEEISEEIEAETDSIHDTKESQGVKIKSTLRLRESPLITEVFADGIQEIDTLHFQFDFDEDQQTINSSILLPVLSYQENTIDSLYLDLKGNKNSLVFDYGFHRLKAGSFEVAKTDFSGVYQNQQLQLIFNAIKDDEKFFHIETIVGIKEDTYTFSIDSNEFLLNGNQWDIPKDNSISITDKQISIDNFKISRNGQSFSVNDDFDIDKQHFGLRFTDFKLSTLTNYLNPEQVYARGKVGGNVVFVDPFNKIGITADLGISNLEVTEVALGDFRLDALAEENDLYQLDLSLLGEQIDFEMNGKIDNTKESPKLSLSADLKLLKMKLIEAFAADYINKSKGEITSHFDVNGNFDDLQYNGKLQFVDAEFNLKMLNAKFRLAEEEITLNNKGLKLNKFTVADNNDNTFQIDGDILTENWLNPDFDLRIKAEQFEALNSTKDDNNLYYGKLVFDADAKLSGNLKLPKVKGKLDLREETSLNYIVPETQIETVEREGVVVFVNRENPGDILTQKDKEQFNAIISGIELDTDINIHKKAKLRVVINKRTGDNVEVQGGGDFKLNMARNGNINLAGKYQLEKGHFEMNLYNLVTRRFEIDPSSSVTWSGDPYNADLDIRAVYNIETSVSSLMASQTTGESTVVQNRYRQQLPFMVYLDVAGEINSPELNFELDMPEDNRGVLNGSVFARISQINQQDDELNKQVFSLLVLNRFYPESGSDGSQGGAASLARNNINQALSDQLNTFADKLTGNTGIQLNFDVNSYKDYQSGNADNRTDLDVSAQKKLFNDRLVVEAGSQVNVQGDLRPGEQNVAIGNVSVEYLLTEDGRWKLRGFRKSEYENVIDGQVFVSGIALIFSREFNAFKELWEKEIQALNGSKNKDDDTDNDKNKKTNETPSNKQENSDKNRIKTKSQEPKETRVDEK